MPDRVVEALTDRTSVTVAQTRFEKRLSGILVARPGPFIVGYQGGNISTASLFTNDRIWYFHKRDTHSAIHRHWNAFGLADSLSRVQSNPIAVEINIPLSGGHRRVAGVFARDPVTKELLLLHRGKIGGGRGGIGKTAFLKWSRQTRVQVAVPGLASLETMLLVASVDAPHFAEQLSDFITSVAAFKSSLRESELQSLPTSELIQKATSSARMKPVRRLVETVGFERSLYVAVYAKRRAAGKCDLCGEAAPFADRNGQPFLECHHIVWLANGGPDTIDNTVALCPNCHRRMHVVASDADVRALQTKAVRRM